MKIEFQIGDIVTCKKDFKPIGYSLEKIRKSKLSKNKNYTIIYSGYWNESIIVYQLSEQPLSFYYTNEEFSFDPSFYEYFYNKRESRKLKLNKLYDGNMGS